MSNAAWLAIYVIGIYVSAWALGSLKKPGEPSMGGVGVTACVLWPVVGPFLLMFWLLDRKE